MPSGGIILPLSYTILVMKLSQFLILVYAHSFSSFFNELQLNKTKNSTITINDIDKDMFDKNFLFIILIIWGIPSTFFRSKFRKIVYKTDDWKINIQPLFKKEIIALFSNIYPENKEYLRIRKQYRLYLFIYLLIFILYSWK